MKKIIFLIVVFILSAIFFYQLGYIDAVDRATMQHCIRATSYEEFEACALNFRDTILSDHQHCGESAEKIIVTKL